MRQDARDNGGTRGRHTPSPEEGDMRFLALTAAAAVVLVAAPAASASGTATDGPGVAASWATGNKLALGTSATTTSKVWFTVAKGITSEVFYPRADVPNMQDMQYVVTDGSTFVDLERDATNHVVSMPDEKSLEYTVTNTAKSGKYKITNTYVTDPAQNTLLIKTRFQSLDGGTYRLYLLENPSMAGGGGNDNAWWDGTNGALMASDTETLFGSPLSVVSALKTSTGFAAHDDGFSGRASDCYVDLSADKTLNNQFDNISGTGNVVQCGQISVGSDTTFTVALGYGSDSTSALASPASPRRGATSRTATASTTATTASGAATSTSRRPACSPRATRRRRCGWRSSCGARSTSRPP